MEERTDQNLHRLDLQGGIMPRDGGIYPFMRARQATLQLVEPLSEEDMLLSSTPDTSPPKWHLAHTTWFFESFILREFEPNFEPFHQRFDYLFNSYYETLGDFLPKKDRGLLIRPTLNQIIDYRRQVDNRIFNLLQVTTGEDLEIISALLELGIHHEKQHQELLLMDIKLNFFSNPLLPAYAPIPLALALHPQRTQAAEQIWGEYPGGLVQIGADPDAGFCYDNEGGVHRVWIEPFQFSLDLVTNAEFMQFIEDGGYEDPQYWLSDGWAAVQKNKWKHPLYWIDENGAWKEFTLYGQRELELDEPVSHVSYYEAQAFAKWAEARLPTEFEWEYVSGLEGYPFHHGKLWEWTQSAYLPYPGHEAVSGALEEYNFKFMCNQFVLRGGSFATPPEHYRHTYRNFYYPDMRWQFCGFRLARDV